MKNMKFSTIVRNTLHKKRWSVKQYIIVAPKWRRDARGRFTGGMIRRGYTRRIYDYAAPKVTAIEMLAANIANNNSLLHRLKTKGMFKKGVA